MKETEDCTNKWKDTLCSWIGKINIVKMSILHKAIYRFNAIPIKVSMAGTSLVAQWLRLCASNAEGPASILGQGNRPHVHASTKSSCATTKETACCN